MADFQNEMNKTVAAFVSQIAELARRAAIGTLESAFGEAPAPSGRGAAKAAAPGRPRGQRGVKRTAADIEALAAQMVTFVKAHPGMRIEQINRELGTTTKDLALPIRKLIAEGTLATKGQKRSTTYFPGKKSK